MSGSAHTRSSHREDLNPEKALEVTLRGIPHQRGTVFQSVILASGVLSKVTETWLSKRTSVRNRGIERTLHTQGCHFFRTYSVLHKSSAPHIKGHSSGQIHKKYSFISLSFGGLQFFSWMPLGKHFIKVNYCEDIFA